MLPGLCPLLLLLSRSVVSSSLRPHGLQPARLPCPWNFPGKNTGVGCCFLLQGIFPTQGWNLLLLHWQVDPLLLSHQRSPFFLVRDKRNCTVLSGGKKQESSVPCHDHLPVMKTRRQWVHIFCLKETVACEIRGGKKRLSVFTHGACVSALATAHT